MMMTKPTEEAQEESAPPAFAAPPPSTLKVGSVEDLERKLAMISADENKSTTTTPFAPPPAPAAVPTVQAPAATAPPAAAVKGGKNALLARIMAAKEKSQQQKAQPAVVAPPAPAAPTTGDLLSDFDTPSAVNDPPPSYDTNFLDGIPPPAAPPAFDAVENTVMQQVNETLPPPPSIDDVLPPPPPPPGQAVLPPPSAPAASAPSFEDLLGGETQQQQFHPPPVPPPMEAPPAEQGNSGGLDIDESILNALEPAEREAFLEEQRKIMEQIEKEKTGNQASGAAARAAAFDQRSTAAVAQVAASYDGSSSRSRPAPKPSSATRSSATPTVSSRGTVNLGEGSEVPLHGQEKTQQAIKDGTALIVQCLSCNNWMQVTGEAEVMMCPLCNTITRVERAGAATTADMEAAAQMAADAELAEKLQKEEYSRAGGGSSRSRNRNRQAASSSSSPRQAQGSSAAGEEQSWYDWFMGVPAPAPATSAAIASGARSAEIRPQTGLISAQTGEEGRGSRPQSSFDSGLSGGGGARVAEQKSMFACVADAVGTAATQMTAYSLEQDDEGNYHGVDGSSLLAMPDVSRQRES